MKLLRLSPLIILCLAAAGCVGESIRSVELRRELDGAKAICMSNVYAVHPFLPSQLEQVEKQYVADCVAACLEQGFAPERSFPSTVENDLTGRASAAKCEVIGKSSAKSP